MSVERQIQQGGCLVSKPMEEKEIRHTRGSKGSRVNCQPCHERGRREVPAVKTIAGTPMCADCFEGKPTRELELYGVGTLDRKPDAKNAERCKEYYWRRKAKLAETEAQ